MTTTERSTGFLLMRKLKKGKIAKNLAKEIVLMMLQYKKFVLSITSDNGCEFYEHKMIAKKLQTEYFFAHPYSSWERGLNEYTNKLIRQYIPKKQLFDQFDNNKIIIIQHKINKRHRKILNFENPKYFFYNKIALLS